ncbi:hypothetical protein QQ045_004610 [Rhodiola kirilowii]
MGGRTPADPTTALVASTLIDSVKRISSLPECTSAAHTKRMYNNLVRRIKLLNPFFEELADCRQLELGQVELKAFEGLNVSLGSAFHLLNSINGGSKIYQALEREKIATYFCEVNKEIESALGEIPYDKYDLSDEVKEQTELVHAQFRRAKGRIESPDSEIDLDLAIVQVDSDPGPEILERLSEKLQLRTINELKKESVALHEIAISSDEEAVKSLEKISSILKMLTDRVLDESSEEDFHESEKASVRHKSPVIPDDFRCPISLELMKDPVIVSTGQTYERSCIQKWLEAGHKTCPKTQQSLLHTALTPNYVLKSLIALWCESNGVELPKKDKTSRTRKERSVFDCDRAAISALLHKLANGNPEQQRAAAGELRLLAKRNADNRVCIAGAGAIPLLVELLSSPDTRTQEHAVTALLNLSINESNKGSIVNAGAIPDIVDVLKNGSTEARENAAATLFSLSVVDENKVAIGAAGAIPPLIDLLCHGTPRGKKDAATAIFNLSMYQGNKVRAVRAGIVGPLMRLLKDAAGGMVDEAVAILAIIASHPEGKMTIAQADPVPILVEFIRTGSVRNRENAVAILWSLCTGDAKLLINLKEVSGEDALKELVDNGTDRARRKAANILELLEKTDSMPDP